MANILRYLIIIPWVISLFLPCVARDDSAGGAWNGMGILGFGFLGFFILPFTLQTLAWLSNFFLVLYIAFAKRPFAKIVLFIGVLLASGSFFIKELSIGPDVGMVPFQYLIGSYFWGFSWILSLIHCSGVFYSKNFSDRYETLPPPKRESDYVDNSGSD